MSRTRSSLGCVSGSFPTVYGTTWKEVTNSYQLSLRLNKHNVAFLRDVLGKKNMIEIVNKR